jgi:acetylornithine deacetylase/succinyl-diaminopimelate desuccinylase-like protein
MTHDVSADHVAQQIKPDEVVDLALALGGIPSPSGAEHAASDYVYEWCAQADLAPRRMRVEESRAANVVARIPGSGGGRSLLFNSHLDTAVQPGDTTYYRDPARPEYFSAWRDGDDLVGIGVVNDKGPMAAWLVAAATVRRELGSLPGDVILTAVTGEIGFEPVDDQQGLAFHGKDFGSRYIATHGAVADLVLVAETTSFVPVWAEPGKAYFRVDVLGRDSAVYTPYLNRPYPPAEHPNAVVRAAVLVPLLEAWSLEFQERHREQRAGGEVVPKVNIGAIRAGNPSQPILTPAHCTLYLDVRLPVGATPLDVLAELRELVRESGVPGEVDCYLFRRGYEAVGAEPLISALRDATALEVPDAPERAAHSASSMWRDLNVWNELGIPAVTYGPGVGTGGGNAALSVDELVAAARVYARAMVEICRQPRA